MQRWPYKLKHIFPYWIMLRMFYSHIFSHWRIWRAAYFWQSWIEVLHFRGLRVILFICKMFNVLKDPFLLKGTTLVESLKSPNRRGSVFYNSFSVCFIFAVLLNFIERVMTSCRLLFEHIINKEYGDRYLKVLLQGFLRPDTMIYKWLFSHYWI